MASASTSVTVLPASVDVTTLPFGETSSAVVASTYVRPKLGNGRRYFMLFLFCFAEFMDAFIGTALPGFNST